MYLESTVHWIPLFFASWTLTGWLICYIVAWATGHIDPILPLISMCGAQWPESSIFSLFMNVSSLFSGMICYFRFRQVQHFQMRCSNISQIWKLNVLGLLLGVASAIGLIIVANFQEARAPWPQVRDYDLFHKKFRSYTLFSFFGFQAVVFVYFAHVTGALVTFTSGILCAVVQAWLTRLMHPEIVEMDQFWLRSLIAIFGVMFYVTAVTCGSLAHVDKQMPNLTFSAEIEGPVGWDPTSPSYKLDLAFAGCEWGVALVFVSYFVSLYPDFKRLKLKHCFDSTHRSLRADSDLDDSNLISREITAEDNIKIYRNTQSSMRSNRSNRVSQEYERQL